MSELTLEQIKLLEQNKIIPTGCPVEQVNFFNEVCKRKKLDPFTRQIHLVERKSKDNFGKWVASYTIQAGIDGMRAIAQRNATIISYKRWVEKREDDLYGICEIATSDRGIYKDELPFSEYAQKKGDGTLNSFWAKFPQTMIKKCAEESVLRMMTPEDLSGVYGDDEMMQADAEPKEVKQLEPIKQSAEAVDLPKIDYMTLTDHIKTKEQYLEWVATLSAEEDKTLYNLKQQIQYRISKLNVDKIIEKINARTNEKTFYTVDQIIS
jgi:phage recombination protein Bet